MVLCSGEPQLRSISGMQMDPSRSLFCLNRQVVDPESTAEYVARLHKGQVQCLDRLRRFIDGSAGKAGGGTLDVSQVPFFDMEVAGVYPLR